MGTLWHNGERIIMRVKLADFIDAPKTVLQESLAPGALDLLTRAGGPAPCISVVAPSNTDGWEMIEITVDSGSCDTVLPKRMLARSGRWRADTSFTTKAKSVVL